MEKTKLIISFSGGRTSAYMTHLLLNDKTHQDLYEMKVVYANTGKEREETLEFIEKCNEQFDFNVNWIEAITNPENKKGVTAKMVNFETASRNGEPFEAMIKKHGIPNVKSPICTRELKNYAIRAYCRQIGWLKHTTAIGIRFDEIDRINPSWEKEHYYYPLCSYQWGANKQTINDFWNKQDFDLELKPHQGNCDLCFKKSFRKLMMVVKENPELIEWWKRIEDTYENYLPQGRIHNKKIVLPVRPFRQNKSIMDIVDMAHKPEAQLMLFDDIDISNGCTESCEVF